MSDMNYNKLDYIKLLRLRRAKKAKGLNETDKLEFKKYASMICFTLDWETKEVFLNLLEKFSSGELSSFHFYLQFSQRYALNMAVFQSLMDNELFLSPRSVKSEAFSDLICEIMNWCDSYEETFQLELTEESHYVEFRNAVEKIYLKIKNLLNEE